MAIRRPRAPRVLNALKTALLLIAGAGCAYNTTAEPSLGVVNRAVDTARNLFYSDNPYDQILGAGTLCDIGDQGALALLEDYATSSDIVFQRSAIDTLIGVQHPIGIDLIFRLAAENPSFTQFLTQSLATNPRDDMGEFLLSLLPSSKPVVQQYAIQALVHMPDTAGALRIVKEVVAAADASATTKAYGYYYLAHRGFGSEIEQPLLDIVASGDMTQREVAAVALRYLTTRTAKVALEQLRRSTDARVALAALASSAALGDQASIDELIDVIVNGKSLKAEVGASAFRRLPPAMAYRLSVELFAQNLRSDPGARLLESWRAIEWDASAVYVWGLAHDSAAVRMQTLWLAGQRQERSMLAELAKYLGDEDPGIRGMAAWAIVHIAPEEYIPGMKV